MHARQKLIPALVVLSAWLMSTGAARADTVLYDNSGFIQGEQSFVQAFDITTPGTLTITLSSIPWLDTISDLNAFLSTSTGLIGDSMGVGSESMKVGTGMLYAHWFGDADGVYGIGVYGIKVTFHPTVSTVPLPASVLLLLSGLGAVLGWPRRSENRGGDEALTI